MSNHGQFIRVASHYLFDHLLRQRHKPFKRIIGTLKYIAKISVVIVQWQQLKRTIKHCHLVCAALVYPITFSTNESECNTNWTTSEYFLFIFSFFQKKPSSDNIFRVKSFGKPLCSFDTQKVKKFQCFGLNFYADLNCVHRIRAHCFELKSKFQTRKLYGWNCMRKEFNSKAEMCISQLLPIK